MLKIAGVWDVWDNSAREFEVHWRHMLKHFGVDVFYMTPITGVASVISRSLDSTECRFAECLSIQYLIDKNPKLTPVIVDERGDILLNDFEHPKNVLYVFGKVGWSPLDHLKNEGYPSIRIPSWSKDPNLSLGMLHPHQAASIVLYDNRMKSWQSR